MKDLVTPMPDFQSWAGKSQTSTGYVSAQIAAMAQATLCDADTPALVAGDRLPPLWHWYAFPPQERMADLGPDGHPQLGGFLPPVPFERRMWAGGRLSFHAPLKIGEPITRTSTIAKITEKDGAAGGMVFVAVDHVLSGAEGVAVRERQDIVYLPLPDTYSPPPKRDAVPGGADLLRSVDITPPLLMRYSAVTFNAHRIHYDRSYASDVEKYPGLVVHGPLQAQLLMDVACAVRGAAPDQFEFRGVHPMLDDGPMQLIANSEGNAVSLTTAAAQGHICMTAKAIWGDLV